MPKSHVSTRFSATHRGHGREVHAGIDAAAGWAAMHHALQVAEEPDEDGNDVYNIFESFKPEHNRHRPFESKDGSVVAAGEDS